MLAHKFVYSKIIDGVENLDLYSKDLMKGSFLILWFFGAPLVLFLIYYRKKRKNIPIEQNKIPSSGNEKIKFISKVTIFLGLICLIPVLLVLFYVPIFIFNLIIFLYFYIKKDKKNANLTSLSLIPIVIGFILTFIYIDIYGY